MPSSRVRLLGLSGSLRSGSSNTALLEAARMLAPSEVEVTLFGGLSDLPPFNPDLDSLASALPASVQTFRAAVKTSDGLLIACPEYAHGVPGAFKNALDWLVGGPEFPGNPIALFHATTRGTHARAALTEILTTMSGVIVPEASVELALLGRSLNAEALANEKAFAPAIASSLRIFASAIRK